jgi:acyl carrier protein
MSDVEARLSRCFAAVFPKLSRGSIPSATPDTVPEWDSVATVTLFKVIEEEFGPGIDLDDAEDLMSFTSLRDRLEPK